MTNESPPQELAADGLGARGWSSHTDDLTPKISDTIPVRQALSHSPLRQREVWWLKWGSCESAVGWNPPVMTDEQRRCSSLRPSRNGYPGSEPLFSYPSFPLSVCTWGAERGTMRPGAFGIRLVQRGGAASQRRVARRGHCGESSVAWEPVTAALQQRAGYSRSNRVTMQASIGSRVGNPAAVSLSQPGFRRSGHREPRRLVLWSSVVQTLAPTGTKGGLLRGSGPSPARRTVNLLPLDTVPSSQPAVPLWRVSSGELTELLLTLKAKHGALASKQDSPVLWGCRSVWGGRDYIPAVSHPARTRSPYISTGQCTSNRWGAG